ncbi:MAG TPA: hypothetical protein VJY62_09230 [Bacteroidia bacterium]|nr:hypothetical protein [Bacteroidia bacterium]
MEDRQSRHENRDRAVLTFMDTDPTIWNGQAIIVTKHDLLADSILAIDTLATIQEMDITGNAQQKAFNRLLMAQKGIEIAGPLAQFAKDNGNLVLFHEINFAFSSLLATKETTAEQRNQLVHDRANTNVASLTAGGYGVNAAALLDYQVLINNFKNTMSAPKDAEAVTIAATEELALEVKEADDFVTDLKRLMKPLKSTEPDFFLGFMASTKIVNTGSHKIYADVKLEDSVTDERIPKGTMKVVELNLTVQVSKRGVARVKDSETGTFRLIIESPNYVTQTIDNFVMTGKKPARLIVKMVKV